MQIKESSARIYRVVPTLRASRYLVGVRFSRYEISFLISFLGIESSELVKLKKSNMVDFWLSESDYHFVISNGIFCILIHIFLNSFEHFEQFVKNF